MSVCTRGFVGAGKVVVGSEETGQTKNTRDLRIERGWHRSFEFRLCIHASHPVEPFATTFRKKILVIDNGQSRYAKTKQHQKKSIQLSVLSPRSPTVPLHGVYLKSQRRTGIHRTVSSVYHEECHPERRNTNRILTGHRAGNKSWRIKSYPHFRHLCTPILVFEV